MIVKIIKSTNSFSWYSNYIGEIISVDIIVGNYYRVKGFQFMFILKDDCEVIEEGVKDEGNAGL